jgi:sugar O-acyltransferase (sialic acid O-acetyltransferase NeuD family)
MILFGASGHAKVIIDILEKMDVTIEYLLDADPEIQEIQGYEVRLEQDVSFQGTEEVIISIGSNSLRKTLASKLSCQFGWAIHPSVILGDDVSIGAGTVVMAGAIINSSTSIGNHNIINTSTSIDHDCHLEDFVHVSPNATLCGSIKVGEGTHIGAGATIIPNLNIGKWVTIGAGAVIIEDVLDYAVVVGNPGKVIKYNER